MEKSTDRVMPDASGEMEDGVPIDGFKTLFSDVVQIDIDEETNDGNIRIEPMMMGVHRQTYTALHDNIQDGHLIQHQYPGRFCGMIQKRRKI